MTATSDPRLPAGPAGRSAAAGDRRRSDADPPPDHEHDRHDGHDGHDELPTIVITPAKGWIRLGLADVWAYRELLYFLTWRDIKVRYKQTALGAAWAVLQPFLTMVVFSLFFGRLAQIPSEGVPYPLFSYAALVPWTFFANGVTLSSQSMVGNANLITKVYFPRLIVPAAAVVSGLVDFGIAMVVLFAMMAWYGEAPDWQVLTLPAFLLLAMITSLGVGLWLSALNVRYRDVRYVVPFLIQFWLFATPIAYPSTLLTEPWRTLYGLNPMVGVVEGFRWALFDTRTSPGLTTLLSAVAAVALLVTGAYYFRRMEKTFADVV
ncbi:MAG: ABC transporter permease [Acidimicrobiales bacterium]|nr:ABC transporter permease [Acidimicrobiales bacterium]